MIMNNRHEKWNEENDRAVLDDLIVRYDLMDDEEWYYLIIYWSVMTFVEIFLFLEIFKL